MNIGTDGTRYVAHIEYYIGIANNDIQLMERAKVLSEYFPYDEVYVMGFDCNCIEFINDVVFRGCRV